MGESSEIFQAACQTVAAALEPDGFRWIKSENDLVRKDGPFTFRLHFQSSPRNQLLNENNTGPIRSLVDRMTRGTQKLFVSLPIQLREINQYGLVEMIAHVGVDDARIAKWRKTLQNPIRKDSAVTGSNLGYFAKENAWLTINLANPHARSARLVALISLIREKAFPFFDRFHRDEEVLKSLLQPDSEVSIEFAMVEHAVFLGGMEAGRKMIERFFLKWPNAESEYRTALDEYRANGIPEVWDSAAGPRLAKVALCVGIEDRFAK